MNSETSGDVCPICGGFGVITKDVPVGHEDFGKAFPCVCQADKIKVRKSAQLLEMSNLDAYAERTFATFEINFKLLNSESAALREAFAPARNPDSLTDEQWAHVNTVAEYAYYYARDPQGWLLLQ